MLPVNRCIPKAWAIYAECGIPTSALAAIWKLSDVDGDQFLDSEEFALMASEMLIYWHVSVLLSGKAALLFSFLFLLTCLQSSLSAFQRPT